MAQPDQITISRILGNDHPEARLHYGITAEMYILELCYESATQLSVLGETCLRNEAPAPAAPTRFYPFRRPPAVAHATFAPLAFAQVRNESYPCPILDHVDMQAATVRMDMSYRKFNCVLMDEAHDMDDCQELALKSMQSNGANLCTVDDDGQFLYGWRGVEAVRRLPAHAPTPAPTGPLPPSAVVRG